MDREKQLAELLKVLKDSRAVTYEPNAYPIELCRHGQKEEFYVSERDGHLTIDYGVFAKDLYDAGYRKQSEVIDELVKMLLDAFPEANRDNHCPAIYYDDYRDIIEESAERMKGE